MSKLHQFIKIQVFFSIFTVLFISGFHKVCVYLNREGTEEPFKKFGKSVAKMAVMHE